MTNLISGKKPQRGNCCDDSSAAGQPDQRQAISESLDANDSPVSQMFTGRSVFITGASGFIGRVLLEKLLRCYPKIKNIYILMRQKKNQNPYDRLHKQLLNVPIFDKIRAQKNGQELLDKIVVIPGDIADSWLGISDSNLERLCKDQSLSIVFHSAATIKFDEPLKVSVKLNLIATRTVIEFCRRLPNLISFCHVSTCYTNSDILDQTTQIEEKIYPISDDPKNLMQLADILEEDLMQTLKRNMVKERPNTYTYTKALAEKYIATEASDLPVAIVRPSIVVCSWKDPMPGWVDNINGPTGLLLAISKGLLRSMHCKTSSKADIIPVDVVVNAMIASSYYAARAHDKFHPITASDDDSAAPPTALSNGDTTNGGGGINNNDNSDSEEFQKKQMSSRKISTKQEHATSYETSSINEKEALALPKPPVFQINSGDLNPITWGLMESFLPIMRKYPSCQVLRYPYGSFKTNRWHDLITRLFVHYLPALILDMICLMTGKKRQMLSIYYKLDSAIGALTHFTTNNYNFRTTNLTKLRAILSKEDNETLFTDIENLNWADFWDSYCLGCRRYILREKDETIEEARKSFQKARYIEWVIRTMLVLLLLAGVATTLYSYGFNFGPPEQQPSCSSPNAGHLEPLVETLNGTCHNRSSSMTMGTSSFCEVPA